jgi:putative glutamine amidotransferase
MAAPMDLSPDIRTDFERVLFEAGLRLRKPMLGICLGHQAMNIYRGGSIIQDMEGHKEKGSVVRHDVIFTEGGRLAGIAGLPSSTVNSTHHQSLKNIGDGFAVAASAPDGIIEAIEMPGEQFVIGVQWHPEKLIGDPVSERLFGAFIEACKEKAHG